MQLIDNQSQQPKMIAQLHQDNNGQPYWSAINLPLNSPGLSQQDVNKFTNPQFVHTVKQAIHQASQQSTQNSAQTQNKKLVHR